MQPSSFRGNVPESGTVVFFHKQPELIKNAIQRASPGVRWNKCIHIIVQWLLLLAAAWSSSGSSSSLYSEEERINHRHKYKEHHLTDNFHFMDM